MVPFFCGIYVALPFLLWMPSLRGVHGTAVMVVVLLGERSEAHDGHLRDAVRIIDEENYPYVCERRRLQSAWCFSEFLCSTQAASRLRLLLPPVLRNPNNR